MSCTQLGKPFAFGTLEQGKGVKLLFEENLLLMQCHEFRIYPNRDVSRFPEFLGELQ